MNCFQISVFDWKLKQSITLSVYLFVCKWFVCQSYEAPNLCFHLLVNPKTAQQNPRRVRQRTCRCRHGDLGASGEPKSRENPPKNNQKISIGGFNIFLEIKRSPRKWKEMNDPNLNYKHLLLKRWMVQLPTKKINQFMSDPHLPPQKK